MLDKAIDVRSYCLTCLLVYRTQLDDNKTIWVTMRGSLLKCSAEKVRPATDDEWMGAELMKILSEDSRSILGDRGRRGFVDTSSEEGPGRMDAVPGTQQNCAWQRCQRLAGGDRGIGA